MNPDLLFGQSSIEALNRPVTDVAQLGEDGPRGHPICCYLARSEDTGKGSTHQKASDRISD